MTARPIIFSTPMVRALLDGRKTQTRRLAWRKANTGCDDDAPVCVPSLWQRVQPGDLLWVREAITPAGDQPRVYAADHPQGRGWASPIHMPRYFSRLTLEVATATIEGVQDISGEDVRAEGIAAFMSVGGALMFGVQVEGGFSHPGLTRRETFTSLWCDLHGPGAWNDNPEVVALTFTVHKQNVDTLLAQRRAA